MFNEKDEAEDNIEIYHFHQAKKIDGVYEG